MNGMPTSLIIELDLRAANPAAVRAALGATIMAFKDDIEPNMIWGDGYRVGIKVGGTR